AVGEAFCYATAETPTEAMLATRLSSIAAALRPGGILLFDVATPGRSNPEGRRQGRWENKRGDLILLAEVEAADSNILVRDIDIFTCESGRYRRWHERHTLVTYHPEVVLQLLDAAGFVGVERLTGYDTFEFRPGWEGFLARTPL